MNNMNYEEFRPRDGQAVIAFTKVSLPFGWLGNMSPDPVYCGGKVWLTSEALFQALRFPEDHEVREFIRAQKSPMAAKMVAKKYTAARCVEPRSVDDVELMRRVLRMKLEQNLVQPVFATNWRHLVEMGNALIIEDCSRRQSASGMFWGAALIAPKASRWRGSNRLGQLWMEIVQEYQRKGGTTAVD